MPNGSSTVRVKFHLGRRRTGHAEVREGVAPALPSPPPGRIPRIAKLMALAIRF